MSYDFYTKHNYSDSTTIGGVTMPNVFTKAGDIPYVDGSGVLTLATPEFTAGPSSATVINTIPVFADTTGRLLEDTSATISPEGKLNVANLGVGLLNYPAIDGSVDSALVSDGAGNLSLQKIFTKGPESSTATAIPVFSDITGKVLQDSSVTIDSAGKLVANDLAVGALSYPSVDSTAGSLLATDGSGHISFVSPIQPSIVYGSLSTVQNSNLGVGDHVKVNLQNYSYGTSVSLDSTTAYSNAANVDSLGRFKVSPNGSYLLECKMPLITLEDHNSTFTIQWYNADDGSVLGAPLVYTGTGTNVIFYGFPFLQGFITTTSAEVRVECRITANNGLTEINTCYVNVINLNQL